MDSKKLSNKELQELKDYQEKINLIVISLGKLDLQISSLKRDHEKLVKDYQEIEKSQYETAKSLQDKYGEGNINLENGEFTPTN
jgi:hypothetical protein